MTTFANKIGDMDKLKSLSEKIRKATFAAFKKALDEVGKEELCGFALYTDESAMSLGVTINTAEHFNAVTKKRPKFKVSNQWSPPEWKEEGYEEELFEEISDELSEYNEEIGNDDDQFTEFTQSFFEECVEILEDLKKTIPEDINADFVLVFDISDYEDTDELVTWVKRLNSPEKAADFEKMMESF